MASEWDARPTIELVEGAQAGQPEAREALFARYSGRVLAIVRARMGPKLRAQVESADIAQEALIEALQSLERFEDRGEASLIRWLATIVQNRIGARAKYFGAERRAAAGSAQPIGESSGSFARIDPASAGASPSLEVRRAEEASLVEACLHELSEDYRELILLRDYAGASWEEVAEAAGAKSPDAARMMHSRARTQLGRLLAARGLA
jgi:RNA polymerase sigma-70 factor (ECF subfamily)